MKSPYGLKFNGYLISQFPKMHAKFIDTRLKLITKVETNKYIKKIPETMGLKTSRFTKAFIENFFFYKLTLPITLPGYIYLSVLYVRNKKAKKIAKNKMIEEPKE